LELSIKQKLIVMSTEMENKNEEFLDINSYEEIEENEQTTLDTLSVKELLSEMESIVNKPDAGAHAKKFNQLKDKAYHLIQDEIADKKHDFVEEGNDMEDQAARLRQMVGAESTPGSGASAPAGATPASNMVAPTQGNPIAYFKREKAD